LGRRFFSGGAWNDGFVTAEGPWIAIGTENPAALKIECLRDRAECIVAEAEYGEQLIPTIDHFDIQRWDAVEIRSKPFDNVCQRSVVIINRVEESVTIQRSALSKSRECEVLQTDTSVAYNHTSHLATDAETDSMEREHSRIVFSMLDLTPALRRRLSLLSDTAALRAAFEVRRPRH